MIRLQWSESAPHILELFVECYAYVFKKMIKIKKKTCVQKCRLTFKKIIFLHRKITCST